MDFTFEMTSRTEKGFSCSIKYLFVSSQQNEVILGRNSENYFYKYFQKYFERAHNPFISNCYIVPAFQLLIRLKITYKHGILVHSNLSKDKSDLLII